MLRGGSPFEFNLAAEESEDATPENKALWQYLKRQKPWLFWEWHSNNWFRRPGHMLLRYRSELLEDAQMQRVWDEIEERLLFLPNTHHANWTSYTKGPYQNSPGFQAITRLGAISCIIKQHDKYSLSQSQDHAISCLKTAASVYQEIVG